MCAVQTNQQVKGCQSLSSQRILEMLNQLSLYSVVIKIIYLKYTGVYPYLPLATNAPRTISGRGLLLKV